MKIEIWSDYACPFCYIGEKRMEKALAEIPGGDKVEVEFKSFELDPTASGKVMSSTVDRFAMKYGLPSASKRFPLWDGARALIFAMLPRDTPIPSIPCGLPSTRRNKTSRKSLKNFSTHILQKIWNSATMPY